MKNIIFLLASFFVILEIGAQKIDFTTYSKNTMAGTKYGAISASGDTLLKADYDQIYKFNGKYFVVRNGEYSGIVDTSNKIIIPLKYGALTNISDGRLFVGNGSKYALADINNKLLTGYVYDNAWMFSEGIAKVKIGDYLGYINKSGVAVIPIKFIEGSDYCKYGKVIVHVRDWKDLGNYKITYITGYNTTVNAGYSSDCPIVFNKDGAIIYRSTNGNEKIKILPNGNLLMTVYDIKHCSNEVIQIMDSKGKIAFNYDQCCEVDKRYDSCMVVYAKRAEKKGIIDYNGKILLPIKFKEITDFDYNNGNYLRVYFDDKIFFYADNQGKCHEFDGVKCPD